jgi:signal-transduction protein with cAMP-binding, CBS, and nucleotidyltransferase domain
MTTLPTITPRLAAPPEALDEDPLLSTVMSRDVVAIDAGARLPTALHVMATTGVRHLPVVERGRCVGVLVEADLIRCLAADNHPFATAVTTVVRHLSRRAPELPPTARVSDAARTMSGDVSDAVLVIERERVLGIVTATDLVRLLAQRDARRTP